MFKLVCLYIIFFLKVNILCIIYVYIIIIIIYVFYFVNKLNWVFDFIGIKKGDRIVIYMFMILEFVVVMLVCVRIGVVYFIIVSIIRSRK